jgi:hypothetical protein
MAMVSNLIASSLNEFNNIEQLQEPPYLITAVDLLVAKDNTLALIRKREGDAFRASDDLSSIYMYPENQRLFNQELLKIIRLRYDDIPYALARAMRNTILFLQANVPDSDLIEHYFLYNTENGSVIDLLSWAADIPPSYDHIKILADGDSWREIDDAVRSNPYDPETHASEQTPLMLWLAVRSVFLMGIERDARESTRDYITRVFRAHKLRDGSTRKEAVGRAYAIAISTLQKKGYLKNGKRIATQRGLDRGIELVDSLGDDEIDIRFDEFEEMLNLAQGKRYVNY